MFDDLHKLSKGEHSLEEVAKMAGFKEPTLLEGKYCSICGGEVEVEFDEDWDGDKFVTLPYYWCSKCEKKVFVKKS